MREVINPQLKLGEQDIGAIELDMRSRDDIPQILRGLQHIYITPKLRKAVFAILEEVLPEQTRENIEGKVDPNNGRPGMQQWTILVLGVLRLALNTDYDRIQELANQHKTIRQMLGHSDWADETHYELQTIKNNLRLFTPEILERINIEVINAGHEALKKSPEDAVVARCDSFVVETDVHFPTDLNLLLDAIRKVIDISADLAKEHGLPGWRQHTHHQKKFKKSYRVIQRLRHSTSKDKAKRQQKEAEIHAACSDYLQLAADYLARADETRRLLLNAADPMTIAKLFQLNDFIQHAVRQIDQVRRRIIDGEKIPHEEKVFSLFEPHTEWISKGKAGVPVELGLRVCIVEDRDRFILHHIVMEKITDDQIAVQVVDETQERFPTVRVISMDKGFHSPANQKALKERLECVVLPKKGRRSKSDVERELDPEFIQLRCEHSAVESAINALEQHGMDKCRDHGVDGFKRYIALSVVARNIQRLGAILQQQEQEREKRKRGPYKNRAA